MIGIKWHEFMSKSEILLVVNVNYFILCNLSKSYILLSIK